MIKKVYQKIFSEKTRMMFHVELRKLKSIFLSGTDFFCPCCEKSFSHFLKKGNGLEFRENAVCPNCGSLERTRLLFLYLQNETSIFENNPYILHFAPEDAIKARLIANPHYFDVDINPNFARFQMDITQINYPDNHFDYIICSHVLGHIPNEKKALEEMYRVLKKGGTLLFLSLMDPNSAKTIGDDPLINSPEDRLKHYGEKDLERLYGQDFEARISSTEVQISRVDYRKNFDADSLKKMSLGNGKREIIYIVKKL